MIFVPIAYIPSVILAIKFDLWLIAIIDTFGYAFLIYIFYNRSLSVNFRIYSLMAIAYLLGVILLLSVGPWGAGYLWLFFVPILASIFLNLKRAIFAVIINLFTLIGLGIAFYFGMSADIAQDGFGLESWIVISANFLFLNLISAISIIFIIRGLAKSLENEHAVSSSLEKKSKELRNAKDEAERLNLIKTNFLAQMSHEIRSPISTVMSFVSLIKEKAEVLKDDEIDEYFLTINRGSQRIIRTIDMILSMSEIQSGTYDASFEEINLEQEILKPLVAEFSIIAEKKHLTINMKNMLNRDDKIIADKYSVTQIFVNLIDNAIKYTRKGGIFIVLMESDHSIAVDIIDSGIGISSTYLKELFDPFTQEESGYTRNFDGSGLGLALVKNYCNINNAEIKVESEKGKGTKFTVLFSH